MSTASLSRMEFKTVLQSGWKKTNYFTLWAKESKAMCQLLSMYRRAIPEEWCPDRSRAPREEGISTQPRGRQCFKRDLNDSKASFWRGGMGHGNVSQADSTGHHFYFQILDFSCVAILMRYLPLPVFLLQPLTMKS